MKTLLLLRHAKSSWNERDIRDFDRPLNERGLRDAPAVGELIRNRKLKPDLVLSSPAERARQTITQVLEAARLEVEPRYDQRIYEASATHLFEVVSQIEDSVGVAMLVGHNPGFAELLEALTGKAESLPTAALACIELDIDKWSNLRNGGGRLEWLAKPKK